MRCLAVHQFIADHGGGAEGKEAFARLCGFHDWECLISFTRMLRQGQRPCPKDVRRDDDGVTFLGWVFDTQCKGNKYEQRCEYYSPEKLKRR